MYLWTRELVYNLFLKENYIETPTKFSTNNLLCKGLLKNGVPKVGVLVPNKVEVPEARGLI
jgi:hypothetical protein